MATRPTISASIVKNLRGTNASIKIDVVPLNATCATGELNSKVDSISLAYSGALQAPRLTVHG
jgi:hypothetical protein